MTLDALAFVGRTASLNGYRIVCYAAAGNTTVVAVRQHMYRVLENFLSSQVVLESPSWRQIVHNPPEDV